MLEMLLSGCMLLNHGESNEFEFPRNRFRSVVEQFVDAKKRTHWSLHKIRVCKKKGKQQPACALNSNPTC